MDIKLQLNKGRIQDRLQRNTGPLKSLPSMPIKHHKPSKTWLTGRSEVFYGVLWSRVDWGGVVGVIKGYIVSV